MREAVHTVEAAAGSRNFGLFLALCIGVGALAGIVARPDAWFDTLEKPKFFPPKSLLTIIWLIYLSAMAYVGARLWRHANETQRWRGSLGFWCVQILCAWSWPLLLYKFHALGPALIVTLLGTVCALIIALSLRLRDPGTFPIALMCTIWFFVLATFTFSIALGNVG